MKKSSNARKSLFVSIFGYFREFRVLKETGKEYWGIQIINFLDCTAYFALLTIITLFLSNEIGFDDKGAGYVVTVFTAATTIFLLISGLVTDWLGIRKSLYTALVGRLFISLAIGCLALMDSFPHRGLIVGGLLFLMAPFMSMIQTVFQAANKRFTTKNSRSAGFNLWYLFMNVGAATAGVIVDLFRLSFGLSTTWIVMFGVGTSILSLGAVFMLVKREEQVYGPNEDKAELEEAKAKQQTKKKPLEILKDMATESAFWKFVVLISLLLGVRAVFTYIYILMPKYWTRIMGDGAAIGTLNAINPVLIMVGLIVFIPLANKFNIFKMLVYGSMISALALFSLAMPWQWFSADIVTAHYMMSILCMVVLSVGEVIWSPKLSEYTAAIAPEGQEGSYLGLSMLPWFLAKTLVSLASGHMLVRWVPEGIGEKLVNNQVGFWDSPAGMWFILGIIAIAGPILALTAKNWLTEGARWKNEEEEKETESSETGKKLEESTSYS